MDQLLEQTEHSRDLGQPNHEMVYRSISKAAIGAACFSLLSLLFLVSLVFIVLPLVGVVLGLVALSSIRRFPEELSGRRIARFSLILSALLLVGGTGMYIYEYATEVREGYDRISFRILKDDAKTGLPYSEQAEELDGKPVFLKGWVRPGNRKKNLKDFILVGDLGSCCFGGSPKITDVVAISIQGDDRVDYSWRMRKIHGTFRLNREAARTGEKEVPRVFYQIDADSVE